MATLRFLLGRLIASVYRLSALRLARITFRSAPAPTILSTGFYGNRLFMDVSRSSGSQLLWLQGKRHIKERSVLERLARPGMTVVDVGANIGYYALLFASAVGDKGHIICLEPDPDNLRELQMNVCNNGLEEIIAVKPMAAGDLDGTIKFEAGPNGRVVADGSIAVGVTRLDSLDLTSADLLKVDVEGYEGSVLDGAKETINKFRPVLFLELHPWLLTEHTHAGIVSFLRQRYSSLTAYSPTRGNLVTKALCAYSCISPVTRATNINALVETYESKTAKEPCWIVARE